MKYLMPVSIIQAVRPCSRTRLAKKAKIHGAKNAQKASQASVNPQLIQSSLPVLTPAADMLPATPYMPNQHANSLYHPDQQFNKVVCTQQVQAHPLSAPTRLLALQ